MENPQEITVDEMTTWTTNDELLLSYAVKRHGFKKWNAVAMEIQSRTSLRHDFITPDNCKLKFLDLKRRFEPDCIQNDDVSETTAAGEDTGDEISIPWLEDLRNLRVSELRRDVHRSEESIVSLQMKVNKLEEEREQQRIKNRGDEEKPDLENIPREDGSKNAKKETNAKPQNNLSRHIAGKTISDEESDREYLSANESMSTSPKCETRKSGLENGDKVYEPIKSGSSKPDLVSNASEPTGEDTFNESSDTIAEGLTKKTERYASELRDSVSKSKKLAEDEMQSSASLVKKRNRKTRIPDSGAGNSIEKESVSGGRKKMSVKSQPLMTLMELIRSHKHGSLFERRLKSQRNDKYKKLVRQHMDLQTIQKRLQQGLYSSSTNKFYRDLLLLFNNAIVFFPKSSPESSTAHELRSLISSEISKQTIRSNSSPPIPTRRPKQKHSAPIVVCHKRSSNRKSEDGNLMKADIKDRIVTGTRSMTRSNVASKKETPKTEKSNNKKEKEKDLQASVKKRGAADLLKRIKETCIIEKNDGRKDKEVLRPPKPETKEEITPAKRTRTGKKVAAESVPVKRRREDEMSNSKRPKKRSRR